MKKVTIESQEGMRYAVAISDGRHAWAADEPLGAGGDDAGPTSYELLLSALGGCMAITMRMYAERKGWPLDGVAIELTHDKVPAADCTDCTPAEIAAAGPSGRIDVIRIHVSLTGDLDAEQRNRIHEIGNRCPVHRTLESPPKLVSTLD